MMGYGWGFGGIGMIATILFRIIIAWIIIMLIQNSGKFFKSTKDDEALDVLRKKYANGEINKKEYLEKKKNLL